MNAERVKWKCPGCEKLYSVRSTVGLLLCPVCRQKNTSTPTDSLDFTKPPDKPKSEEVIVLSEANGERFPSVGEPPQGEVMKPFVDLAVVAEFGPRPARHRNLARCLSALPTAAKATLYVSVVLAGGVLLGCYGLIVAVVTTPDEFRKWQEVPNVVRVLIPVLPAITGALIIFCGWIAHLTLMTLTELIRATIEIEANTRQNDS